MDLGQKYQNKDGVHMFENKDLKQHKGKSYGTYRGYVYDNKDPKGMGRIRVCVPSVLGVDDESGKPLISGWAYPKSVIGGNGWGMNTIPPTKNADNSNVMVWVEFEQGDINKPIWSGSPITSNGLQEDSLETQGAINKGLTSDVSWSFSSPKGKCILLDDANGALVIKDGKGNSIVLDDNGITIETNGVIELIDGGGNSIKTSDLNGITMATSKKITGKATGGVDLETTSGASGMSVKSSGVFMTSPKVALESGSNSIVVDSSGTTVSGDTTTIESTGSMTINSASGTNITSSGPIHVQGSAKSDDF